jgi:hypothetical protein
MTDMKKAAQQALEQPEPCTYRCEAWPKCECAALEQPARPLCKGIPRRGCNYLAPCDTVCNKCGEIHHHHQMVAQFQAAQQPEQEPLTDTYVQEVPDKCDRIVWRGYYFHLPVSSTSKPEQAHPPRREWQELTREGINQMMAAVGWQNAAIRQADLDKVEKVVRAVEAALRSKNHE